MIAIRDFVAKTRVASTHSASAPDVSGQYKSLPDSAAFSAAGRVPTTGCTRPSRESSPMASAPSLSSFVMLFSAAKRASANGKSKCNPSLGISAGDRLIMIRREGSAIDNAPNADLMRSRASLTALSGRPIIEKGGRPVKSRIRFQQVAVQCPQSNRKMRVSASFVNLIPEVAKRGYELVNGPVSLMLTASHAPSVMRICVSERLSMRCEKAS